jgi:transketolase
MSQSLFNQNSYLRLRIVDMICRSGEGHIPSSFSIVDILEYLYGNELRINPKKTKSKYRDYFILSKGHGAAALYVVLEKYGFLSESEISLYGRIQGILGGHPDSTKVPGVEASTGSLGHGFPMATGIALGLKIQKRQNRVFCLVGDGECQEGTIWESANIASNQKLDNLTVIVDWNESAQQLMQIENLEARWNSFGWVSAIADGHSYESLKDSMTLLKKTSSGKPKVILARTIKGKGVPFLEGHGVWHHKIPNPEELQQIRVALNG